MDNKGPDRVYCDKQSRQIYTQLQKETGSLKGTDLANLYMLAFILGYREGVPLPMKSRDGGGLARLSYFSSEQLAIIKAVAIEKEGIEILLDSQKLFNLADQYANTGIDILKNLVFGDEPGSFETKVEKSMFEILQSCGD